MNLNLLAATTPPRAPAGIGSGLGRGETRRDSGNPCRGGHFQGFSNPCRGAPRPNPCRGAPRPNPDPIPAQSLPTGEYIGYSLYIII
jgi:hypothetical protein